MNTKNLALTDAEIVKLAPSAAARTAAAHCSSKYVALPTLDAVAALRSEGFVAVAARQPSMRLGEYDDEHHSFHSVVMRPAMLAGMEGSALLGGLVAEIHITNASDGTAGFDLSRAMLRLVCTNGLVVWDTTDQVAGRHQHTTAESIIARAREMSRRDSALIEKVTRWNSITLNPEAQQRFAADALALRTHTADRATALKLGYDLTTVIAARRPEDEPPTLWNLFNRAQENGMKGGISGARNGRNLALRGITSMPAEIAFNRALWKLAEDWAAIAHS